MDMFQISTNEHWAQEKKESDRCEVESSNDMLTNEKLDEGVDNAHDLKTKNETNPFSTPVKASSDCAVPGAPKKTRQSAVRSGKELRPLTLS